MFGGKKNIRSDTETGTHEVWLALQQLVDEELQRRILDGIRAHSRADPSDLRKLAEELRRWGFSSEDFLTLGLPPESER